MSEKNKLITYNILSNIIYFSVSVSLFFIGVVVYGIILNIREVTLDEAMLEKGMSNLGEINIVIDRSKYKLILLSDNISVKEYKAVFGKTSSRHKKSFDDNVTPNGNFTICSIDTSEQYYKFFQLDYPTLSDGAEALKAGIIDRKDYEIILHAKNNNECVTPSTKLGSAIGIQGIGKYNFIFKNLPFSFNWTNGSVAINNEGMDELFKVVSVGTKVKVIN